MNEHEQFACYLEDAANTESVPIGFDVWRPHGPGAGSDAARIVYRDSCQLRLDDLELVSFVPGGASLGQYCWCDLTIRLTDPKRLLDAIGVPAGNWPRAVFLGALVSWFRQPLAETLERLAERGDLRNENYRLSVGDAILESLPCPPGVELIKNTLRKVRTFDQYLRELRLREWLRQEIARLQKEKLQGQEMLERLEREKVEDLLTSEERRQSTNDRLSTYIKIAQVASASDAHPGTIIGDYELLTQLGRGGQGQVWKAWERTGERHVVLKLLPRELQNATEEMQRLKKTFGIIQDLQHSSICPVILLQWHGSFGWYQVMKYIDGQTLSTYRATYAAKHGSFPLGQVAKVLRPVAEALDHAHSKKVVHRDIKPSNILVVGTADEVQLVDFGLAAQIRDLVGRVSQVKPVQMEISGTRPYMAPEQWKGEEQDARTDQYALAVVAYELLADRLPFQSPDSGILRDCVLNRPAPRIVGQPDHVNRALLRALAKKPNERFETCGELIAALTFFAQPEEVVLEGDRSKSPVRFPEEPRDTGLVDNHVSSPVGESMPISLWAFAKKYGPGNNQLSNASRLLCFVIGGRGGPCFDGASLTPEGKGWLETKMAEDSEFLNRLGRTEQRVRDITMRVFIEEAALSEYTSTYNFSWYQTYKPTAMTRKSWFSRLLAGPISGAVNGPVELEPEVRGAGGTGRYVLWLKPPYVDTPRYVHFNWGQGGNPMAYKIRDYIAGRMLRHPGGNLQTAARFTEYVECQDNRDKIWESVDNPAEDRIEASRESGLFVNVNDDNFAWWRNRLSPMTEARLRR